MARYKKPKWKKIIHTKNSWQLETNNFNALVTPSPRWDQHGFKEEGWFEWDVYDKVSSKEKFGDVKSLEEGKKKAINAILKLSVSSLKILSQRADWADVDIEHLCTELDKMSLAAKSSSKR